MILILGGTTEGRVAVRVLDEAARPYYYSTRGDSQHIASPHAITLTGGMDNVEMEEFCRDKGIRLMIDAAHPFASRLHATVAQVSRTLDLPVIRFERLYPPRDSDIIWCRDFPDAVNRLRSLGITRLLALTGVQTIADLAQWWQEGDVECWFRILDRPESRRLAIRQGFPSDHLVPYDGDDPYGLMKRLHPEAIITKESGLSGGFEEKLHAARRLGIRILAIERPPMPEDFITVTGSHGLRRQIETLLPGFYTLRTGFTTGACATAASKAALTALLTGNDSIQDITFTLPNGEIMRMPVGNITIHSATSATATVIKDAGDDPDVTHGRQITATVTCSDSHAGIIFHGGEGVGTVTLPGLGLPIGSPAINPTPRSMMTRELSALTPRGLDVTISVPGGRELALKTFNPRLGIEGGISIIGTSGIVRPFSNEAFTASIRREMQVALAIGSSRIVLNSGAKSEHLVRALYPDLPAQSFIHYGNAVGEAIRIAAELQVPRLTIGLMIGKAVKLAEGNLDTHSNKVTLNRDFLRNVANEAGCTPAALEVIDTLTLARELWTRLTPADSARFFPRILTLCHTTLTPLYHSPLTTLLISDSATANKIYKAEGGKSDLA